VPPPPWPPASAGAVAAGDWPAYNRDLAGTRHSPLRQITPDNVADLRQVWAYAMGRNVTTGSATGGSQLTPLVIGGVLYLATADRIVALRADTGEERWAYTLQRGAPTRRSLAYWAGEGDSAARLYFTSERRLIALDAATGRKAVEFGDDGEIEMPARYDSAPTRFENLLIVGSNAPPGGVRAFEARTGALVWTFDALPEPGGLGHETWENGAARDRATVQHSAFAFTIDVDRALLYSVFASPGDNGYYGGDRPGDTLFGNSIVALDVRSGDRKWHFQTVHHDIWDYGLPAPPALLDVAISGRVVPLLALAGKTGYLYVLNRVTGEPVFGIEERPAPQSDVPGEQTAATQPIPIKPPPIARVSFAADDIVTAAETTAEHAQFCRDLRERSGALHNAGPFTPYAYRAAGTPPQTTVLFPGSLGGANWGGTAADPTLRYVFVNTTDAGGIGWIEDVGGSTGAVRAHADAYRRTSAVGGPLARFWANDAPPASAGNELAGGELAWPCHKPPWGRLVAVNAATGDIAWQVPLGITQELPEDKQRTGRLNAGGPISTAGGLVFIGAANDRRFRAFDSRTGDELWSAELTMSAHAVPVTYEANGKQYVAIVAAGASAIDNPNAPDAQALVAYALP
jgi:quinoprotein glucose dehydrogenase